MLRAGVLALHTESCSWLKAAFGCIHLDLHQVDFVSVLEESKREFDLDPLTENLMLMMLPFIVRLYELKATNNLTMRLSSMQSHSVACLLFGCVTQISAVLSSVKPSGVCVGRIQG